jgi:hypothetical protein
MVLGLSTLALSTTAAAQEGPIPADTYVDDATRALVQRARDARFRDTQGIDSYEGVMRERIYAGLTALRFRRERGLFESERIARIRWQSDGQRIVQWLAARQAIPIIGADTRRETGISWQVVDSTVAAGGRVADSTAAAGAQAVDSTVTAEEREGQRGVTIELGGEDESGDLRAEVLHELLGASEVPDFAFDPGGDRLVFGSDWALHPLADSAEVEYRYALGDTLRLGLPDGRRIVLLEVRVEPRRADFNLVAGSLWFESENASLVRASYRPARPFNLLLDEPEDAEDVPAFLGDIEAEINYVTVEYSLYEFEFWLPRRFAMEGEARVGSLVQMPITVEWNVRDYEVNRTQTLIPATSELPPGWQSRSQAVLDKFGAVLYTLTSIVPDPDALFRSPELSEAFGERSLAAFSDHEIDELRDELQSLLPDYNPFKPRVAWGLDQGQLRYNRVEGLSFGAAAAFPVTPSTDLSLQARIGTGDREPYGTVSIAQGSQERRWTVAAYRRLESAADHGSPFSTTSSAVHLLMGIDRGVYYRATGASLGVGRVGDRTRLNLEGFYERQSGVERTSDFYLLEPVRDNTVSPVPPADDVDLVGGRATLSWFAGIDPNSLIVTGHMRGEVAGGDRSYQRVSSSLSASHPLPFNLAGAIEVAAGTTWGDLPAQRQFFLGGSSTLRGLDSNALVGDTHWRLRGEIGTGFAGARLTVFTDMGWAGARDDLAFTARTAAVGLGTSLLDGIFRMDVARSYRGAEKWKIYFYLDGLF